MTPQEMEDRIKFLEGENLLLYRLREVDGVTLKELSKFLGMTTTLSDEVVNKAISTIQSLKRTLAENKNKFNDLLMIMETYKA